MKQYELCGFLNMFDIVPDFVYPIFKCENTFYFLDGSKDKIDNFIPVKSSIYERVQIISNYETIIGTKSELLTINSRPLYAFQTKQNEIVCGNAEFILGFFNSYTTSNIILTEEIEDFKMELDDIKVPGKSKVIKKNITSKFITKIKNTKIHKDTYVCIYYIVFIITSELLNRKYAIGHVTSILTIHLILYICIFHTSTILKMYKKLEMEFKQKILYIIESIVEAMIKK